ncbi:MAG: ATP-binding protein [Peptococcales bacterium]
MLKRKPLLIIIILLFSLLAYFITYENAHKERTRIINTNLDRTENIAENINQFIDSHFKIMEIISGIENLDYIQRVINKEESISSLFILDLKGEVVSEVHKELEGQEQIDLFTRYILPYIQYPLKGERYVSGVVQSKNLSQDVIVFATPIYSNKIISGAAFLTIKVDAFIPLLEDFPIGERGYVFLRDGYGHTIYHPQYELIKEKNYKFFDVSLLPRSNYKIQKSSFDDELKYITYHPIENTDWMVFIMQPISEYQSPIYLIWLKNGTLLVLLFLFMYLLYNLEQKDRRLLQTQVTNERLEVVAEVAAGIAHEIKNPLVPIKGYIQLEKLKTVSTLGDETIRLLLKEISRIETIINDFMTLARNNESRFDKVALLEIIKDILMLMQVEADNRGVKLIFNVGSIKEKIFICGDANHLSQVFLNIIKNSLEAMDNSGTIEVNVKLKEKLVLVTVRDMGRGMTPEELRKAGTPFFSTKEQGTGMGLAVSHRIIRNHGGTMEITSQENKGTTVQISLPISLIR